MNTLKQTNEMVDDDGLPINVYLDCCITNQATSTVPYPLTYNQQRTSPFLYDVQKYSMSIIRFYCDTQTLPIWVPTIQFSSTDENQTIYSITLSYTYNGNTYDAQEYLEFIPQIEASSTPTKLADTVQTNSAYYYVYNYSYFVFLINNTFSSAFTSLQTLVTNAGGTLPTSNPPVMTIDSTASQNICTINCDYAGYNDVSGNYIGIWFNPSMFYLLSTFPFIVQSYDSNYTSVGKNMRLITNSFSLNNTILFPPSDPSYTAIQVVQESDSITSALNPISSFVITSSSLPVSPTNENSPTILYNGQALTNSNSNNAVNSIITDFVSDTTYRPNLIYEPSSEYQFHDLIGNGNLSNLNFQVYWKDRYNNYNQFYIPSGGTFSMKILFTKKNRRFPKYVKN